MISAAQNRKRVQPPVDLIIDVCGCSVTPKQFIRDIGFVFDDTVTMAAQIRRVCQVAYCHIRGIATIGKCLSTIACKTIIHVALGLRQSYVLWTARDAAAENADNSKLRGTADYWNPQTRSHNTSFIQFTMVAIVFYLCFALCIISAQCICRR